MLNVGLSVARAPAGEVLTTAEPDLVEFAEEVGKFLRKSVRVVAPANTLQPSEADCEVVVQRARGEIPDIDLAITDRPTFVFGLYRQTARRRTIWVNSTPPYQRSGLVAVSSGGGTLVASKEAALRELQRFLDALESDGVPPADRLVAHLTDTLGALLEREDELRAQLERWMARAIGAERARDLAEDQVRNLRIQLDTLRSSGGLPDERQPWIRKAAAGIITAILASGVGSGAIAGHMQAEGAIEASRATVEAAEIQAASNERIVLIEQIGAVSAAAEAVVEACEVPSP